MVNSTAVNKIYITGQNYTQVKNFFNQREFFIFFVS